MNDKQVKNLKEDLDSINVDEIVRREVKAFGTSAHLNIPRKHIGKKAITLILKQKQKEDK